MLNLKNWTPTLPNSKDKSNKKARQFKKQLNEIFDRLKKAEGRAAKAAIVDEALPLEYHKLQADCALKAHAAKAAITLVGWAFDAARLEVLNSKLQATFDENADDPAICQDIIVRHKAMVEREDAWQAGQLARYHQNRRQPRRQGCSKGHQQAAPKAAPNPAMAEALSAALAPTAADAAEETPMQEAA
jgi:hypothetical protein